MTTVRVRNEGENIHIQAPYNAGFVSKIKTAGGKWNAAQKVWAVHEKAESRAKEILTEIYGECGDGSEKRVDIRVTVQEDMDALQGPVVIAGRSVAQAWGRDTGAKIGEKVSFIQGEPTSGGSVKNWRTIIRAGAVFEMYDVPEVMAVDDYGYTVQIIGQEPAPNPKAALLAERESLLCRLQEIEEMLHKGVA